MEIKMEEFEKDHLTQKKKQEKRIKNLENICIQKFTKPKNSEHILIEDSTNPIQ